MSEQLSWAALPPKSRHRFAMFIAVLSILCPAPAWFGWCSAQCLAPTADNTIRSEPEPASAELVQTDTAVPEHSGKIADSLVFIFFVCITGTGSHILSSDQRTRTTSAAFILTINPSIVQRQLTEGSELQGCRFDEGLVVRNEAGSQQLVPGRGCQ